MRKAQIRKEKIKHRHEIMNGLEKDRYAFVSMWWAHTQNDISIWNIYIKKPYTHTLQKFITKITEWSRWWNTGSYRLFFIETTNATLKIEKEKEN